MKVADFRNHIDRNSTLKDYLKAATRAARGWRIATWYIVTVYFRILTVSVAIGMVATSVLGYYAFILTDPLLFRILCDINYWTTDGLLLLYLSVLLRAYSVSSGSYSDVVVLPLVAIACLALTAYVFRGVLLQGGARRYGRDMEADTRHSRPLSGLR